MNAKKGTRVALYLRVSTSKQETENQRQELEAIAARAGWNIVETYADKGVSGAKNKRPALDAMLKDAARRKFGLLAVWDLARLGRNLRHLLETVELLHSYSVDLFIAKDGLDTSTPAGRLFFNVMGALVEFERERIRERVNAGLARARKQGKHLGRPKTIPKDKARKVRELSADKLSVRKIAHQVGISPSSVQRILSES